MCIILSAIVHRWWRENSSILKCSSAYNSCGMDFVHHCWTVLLLAFAYVLEMR